MSGEKKCNPKLKFTEEETAGGETPQGASPKGKTSKSAKKSAKIKGKQDKVSAKLDDAREKIPKREVKKKQRVYEESKNKAKTKFRFEEEDIPINEAKWNKVKKKSVPRKITGAAITAGANKIHSKIHEAEGENVGTQAAHKAELVGERGVRKLRQGAKSAYRYAKNTPYRRVSKLETKSLRLQMKMDYEKILKDNPGIKSNPLSRVMQKRNLRKQYAESIKAAKSGAKATSAAAKDVKGAASKAKKFVTGVVRKNPITMLQLGALLLIIIIIMSMFTMCSSVFSGITGVFGGASYAAEDEDIDQAELYYTELETDLELEIAAIPSAYPGYDEYNYSVGDISHNPFELMAYLTAVYHDFTFSSIKSVLDGLFAEQYALSIVPVTETRYRTETRTGRYTDSDGKTQTYTYEVEVAYEYYILNVTLTAKSFTAIVYNRMDSDEYSHYKVLMATKGARQYVGSPFDINWLPYVSSYYGYRVHPITGIKNYHKGVDIGLPTGTEILAGLDGTVTTAAWDDSYGYYVIISDGAGLQAKYAHCDTLLVSVGQTVSIGDVIATVGNTGNSTGPHLHIEVLKDGNYLNPLYFVITNDDGSGVTYGDASDAMGDGSFAAMIAEAEKYLGYPYVWGGSSPSTSFDCSGFVCWVINQSGVGSVGRTTAQGLYNYCTPVALSEAQPGDIIFFTGTYSTTDAVTHVGIVVDPTTKTMIHCGNPISYASYGSTYWTQHFYAIGRLP